MKDRSSKLRKKATIRINIDLYQWIEQQVEKGKFQNFNHAVDIAVEKLRDSENKKEPS